MVINSLSRLSVIAANAAPERFRTGVKNQTVPNPGATAQAVYSGKVSGFDFGPQKKNFLDIQAYLATKGKKLVYVGVSSIIGDANYLKRHSDPKATAKLVSFVAVDNLTNPTFVWQKYEGSVAGGGKNLVYEDGKEMKLTFLLENLKLASQLPKLEAFLKEYQGELGFKNNKKVFMKSKLPFKESDLAKVLKFIPSPRNVICEYDEYAKFYRTEVMI